MPNRKRTAIGQRRTAGGAAAAAIRDDEPRASVTAEEPAVQPSVVPTAATEQQEGESSTQSTEEQASRTRSTPVGKTDVSLYWRGGTYEEARRAFWYHYELFAGAGPVDSLRAWIAQAVDVHNRKTTQERAATVKELGKVDLKAGTSRPRPFALDSAIVAEMTQQVVRDKQAAMADPTLFPEWPSVSNYVEAAVRAAIESTKRVAPGGRLPVPPPRLPSGRRRQPRG